jgi:hypothetical protein
MPLCHFRRPAVALLRSRRHHHPSNCRRHRCSSMRMRSLRRRARPRPAESISPSGPSPSPHARRAPPRRSPPSRPRPQQTTGATVAARSSHRASSYIKRLSPQCPVSERVDLSATSALLRRRNHSTRISVSSTGSNVAFPSAYDLSEGESAGSSSAEAGTTQRPAESPPPPAQQPAPAPQVTGSFFLF